MSEVVPVAVPSEDGQKAQQRAVELEADRELFRRLKEDPRAVGEVYDRYAERLYAFLLKRCGHKETAEDLVSHVFVRLIESLPRLEWREVALGAWLYQVASNALIDHYRRASTRLNSSLDADDDGEGKWDPPSADDPAWNAEVAFDGERMRGCLDDLSDRDREVLELRFFAGLEAAEIAERMEISANHASVLVYRATGRLRQVYLKKYPNV